MDGDAQMYDSFDPLLVNLHDSVREHKINQHMGLSDFSDITKAVADILDARLTQTEKVLAADVLVELIKQAETDIRRSLSEKLALRDDIHPTLLHYLAYDKIDVAEPVLQNSPLLSDMDLIYIIESTSSDHWKAIAERANISKNVTHSLVQKQDDKTVLALLDNETIALQDELLEKIQPMATVSSDIAEKFLGYKTLPRSMAVDVYWHVSVALRQSITSKFKIKTQEIDAALQDCVQDFCDTMLQPNEIRPSSLMKEVADLYHRENKINDSLLVGALRRRQGRFFIALFQKRTNLSTNVIWNMMRQVGGQGLAVACRAMKISKENFVSLFLLSRTIVRSNQAVDANELKMAMRYYDGLTYKMAQEILKDSIAT